MQYWTIEVQVMIKEYILKDWAGLAETKFADMPIKLEGWINGWTWMNEWMSEWMNEWMSEWMNEWMNGWFFVRPLDLNLALNHLGGMVQNVIY